MLCYKRRANQFHYHKNEIEEVEKYNVLGIILYSGAVRFQISKDCNKLSNKQLAYNKMRNQTAFSMLLKILKRTFNTSLTLDARFRTKWRQLPH